MFGRTMGRCLVVALVLAFAAPALAAGQVGINVLLNAPVDDGMVADLGTFGKVLDVYQEVNVVTLRASADDLALIQELPYVDHAGIDSERKGAPIDTVPAEDFTGGLSTWNLDSVNVTDAGWANRTVAYDGTGTFVAVLDTGLLGTWRQYFPQERIAEEYAISFGGGGGERGFVSSQPNKWEHDTNSHGTHVTSTILGFDFYGSPINGVAPMTTVIPVKVLNNNGSGWSSVVAAGILYVAELKAGPLADYPVVINMSLGGPGLDPFEKAAIDYAIAQGVIIVAAAGNEGSAGMGYPGAYGPVISVAAAGWAGEWLNSCWWYCIDAVDPTYAGHYYITDFSSWAYAGQDLDVAAPGSWIVGPYQLQMGQVSYYFLGGTSMASPHVAGIVALMMQKYPWLSAADAEWVLEATAVNMSPWPGWLAGSGLVDAAAALSVLP